MTPGQVEVISGEALGFHSRGVLCRRNVSFAQTAEQNFVQVVSDQSACHIFQRIVSVLDNCLSEVRHVAVPRMSFAQTLGEICLCLQKCVVQRGVEQNFQDWAPKMFVQPECKPALVVHESFARARPSWNCGSFLAAARLISAAARYAGVESRKNGAAGLQQKWLEQSSALSA